MADIEAALERSLRDHSRQNVDLIVQVSGDVMEGASLLEAQGAQVKRRFRLTRSISVRCTGRVALSLLKLSWVTRVASDSPVRALRR